MAITVNASTQIVSNSTTASSIAGAFTVSGDMLVVAIGFNGDTSGLLAPLSVTYGGQMMIQRALLEQGSTLAAVAIFTLKNPPAGTANVEVASTNPWRSISIRAWDLAGADDFVASDTGAGDPSATGELATAAADAFLIGLAAQRGNTTASVGGDWTSRGSGSTGTSGFSDHSFIAFDKSVAAPSAQSATATFGASGETVIALVEIASAAATGGEDVAGMGASAGTSVATGLGAASSVSSGAVEGAAAAAGTGSAIATCVAAGTCLAATSGAGSVVSTGIATIAGTSASLGSARSFLAALGTTGGTSATFGGARGPAPSVPRSRTMTGALDDRTLTGPPPASRALTAVSESRSAA